MWIKQCILTLMQKKKKMEVEMMNSFCKGSVTLLFNGFAYSTCIYNLLTT